MPIDTLHNYAGPGFCHMTKSEWNSLPQPRKGSWIEDAAEGGSPHRVRIALIGSARLVPVYLVDATKVTPRGDQSKLDASSRERFTNEIDPQPICQDR